MVLRPDGRLLLSGSLDGKLSFYSCEDARCSSGSLTVTEIGADPPSVPDISRMAIDILGLPVAVFARPGSAGLGHVRCGDADCRVVSATSQVPISTPGGMGDNAGGASAVVGGDGLPLIAFVANSNLYVARCDDISCANPPRTEMMAACVMYRATAAVDNAGVPLVAYQLSRGIARTPFEFCR